MSKDNEVLKFVIRYKARHNGNSPSYGDIMDACGVKSKSHAKYLLDKLQESGALSHDGVRGIVVSNSTWTIKEAQ